MRFRPRFSLRILFVLVAVAACASAWVVGQIRFVHEREAFRGELFASGGSFEWPPTSLATVPLWREWLGDYPVDKICVPPSCESEFRSDAMRLFPEAMFIVLTQQELDEHKEHYDQYRDSHAKP